MGLEMIRSLTEHETGPDFGARTFATIGSRYVHRYRDQQQNEIQIPPLPCALLVIVRVKYQPLLVTPSIEHYSCSAFLLLRASSTIHVLLLLYSDHRAPH